MAHGAVLGQKLEDALLVDGSKSMQANLNMNNHKVTNVTNGTASADAVNYSQLQTKLSLSGGTMTGPINMGNNKITNVANGVADTDAATVGQLNAAVASNIVAIFGDNDEKSGVVIGPTCLYVWKDSTLLSSTKGFASEYATINKWYNLSGLYNKGINKLDLLASSGTNTKTIGSVSISNSSFSVNISTTYCGFAYIQTFNYI